MLDPDQSRLGAPIDYVVARTIVAKIPFCLEENLMGITIHYRGTLDDLERLEEMEDRNDGCDARTTCEVNE